MIGHRFALIMLSFMAFTDLLDIAGKLISVEVLRPRHWVALAAHSGFLAWVLVSLGAVW